MSFNFISQAYAVTSPTAWTGECVGTGDAANVATITGIQCLVANILSPLPAIIALAAVAMMIMAGIKIINAGADAKAYAAGWATFTYAAIGLVLLSVVWFVLVLIENYTGAPVTQFGI